MIRSSACWLAGAVMFGLFSCGQIPARGQEPPKPEATKPETAKPETAKPETAKPEKSAKDLREDEYYELMTLFADTLDQVERNYVKDISRRELMEAAIEGMLTKLDQYSNYIPPKELEQFRSGVESEFGGIGIQIDTQDNVLLVVTPLPGTPAFRAGILAGDRITEIDGATTKGMRIDDAVRKLKGVPGTGVVLTVLRPSKESPQTLKLDLKREIVRVETVLGDRRKSSGTWDFMLDADAKIGYIRVTGFGRHTAEDLKDALKQLTTDGVKGLVLDLRFNPGGLLSSAIEISDLFVAEGAIVSTEGRNVPKRSWNAQKEGTFEGFPMVILVNRYSASASEIVAACLQDHERAVVVGERTWGKGSVQNIIELENGKSALKLTTAGYQRPSGKNIHRFEGASPQDEWGVKPNSGFEVPVGGEELSKFIFQRRERDVARSNPNPNPNPSAESSIPADFDKQLDKGLAYLREKLKSE